MLELASLRLLLIRRGEGGSAPRPGHRRAGPARFAGLPYFDIDPAGGSSGASSGRSREPRFRSPTSSAT